MSKHHNAKQPVPKPAPKILTRAAWDRLTAEKMLETAAPLVDRRVLVLVVCRCARLALRFVPEGEDRPLRAIKAAEAWTRGEATVEEVRAATDAAYAAYAAYAAAAYAAYAAYAAAADAAYAAAHAADAAYAAYYAKRAGVPEADLQDAVRGLWHDADDGQLRKMLAEDPEALAAHLYGRGGRGGRLETCDADERERLEWLSIELERQMGVRTEVR